MAHQSRGFFYHMLKYAVLGCLIKYDLLACALTQSIECSFGALILQTYFGLLYQKYFSVGLSGGDRETISRA
jgi:hypothetical protein